MVDTVALREKVRKAKVLIKEYQAKQNYLDALMQGSKESTSANEKALLLMWIDAASKYLQETKEDYERATILTRIPESDIEQLEACEKALYGS